MTDIGLDVTRDFPEPLTDVVITMGCSDACPIYPGKRYLDWDPLTPDGGPDVVDISVGAQISGDTERDLRCDARLPDISRTQLP